jgi:hypothetical protein
MFDILNLEKELCVPMRAPAAGYAFDASIWIALDKGM